jgi:DNA-binding response OmpR family regulator
MLGTETVDLTAKEFDLLLKLAANPGQVLTRHQLLDSVWGFSFEGYEHTVNSHINRLRKKLEPQPQYPQFILTVWGVGYKFSESYDNSLTLNTLENRSPLRDSFVKKSL